MIRESVNNYDYKKVKENIFSYDNANEKIYVDYRVGDILFWNDVKIKFIPAFNAQNLKWGRKSGSKRVKILSRFIFI